MHQKQPPAKVARARPGLGEGCTAVPAARAGWRAATAMAAMVPAASPAGRVKGRRRMSGSSAPQYDRSRGLGNSPAPDGVDPIMKTPILAAVLGGLLLAGTALACRARASAGESSPPASPGQPLKLYSE